MREVVFIRVTILSSFGDRGAARIGKTEYFGDFIKAFANSVISSSTDDLELIMSGHADDLGVAAGNN